MVAERPPDDTAEDGSVSGSEAGTDEASPPQSAAFDLTALTRFADLAVDALAERREVIDSLNVFPVPDGDTGTNLFLTVEAGRDALRSLIDEAAAATESIDGLGAAPDSGVQSRVDSRAAMRAFARGTILGARGNSGVILSQLISALFEHVGCARPGQSPTTVLAEGMQLAAQAAHEAVGEPQPGTILSVAEAAASAAQVAASDQRLDLSDVIACAAEAAQIALDKTPTQLGVLAQAGVVDAGGEGLCVLLAAAEFALSGRRPERPDLDLPAPSAGIRPAGRGTLVEADLSPEGPSYEVMYLLESTDEQVATLRSELGTLGDSLVIVGTEGTYNVHVHVDDVGAAIEAGLKAGRTYQIAVTHFAEQVEMVRSRREEQGTRRLLLLVSGAGLAQLCRDSGADALVIEPGQRPSTGEVISAVRASRATEVVVFPNDSAIRGVCEAAAGTLAPEGIHVVVVPTRAQVQALAALAVHDPSRSIENDVVTMTAAARGARDGAVTIATEGALTSAGPCQPGDVLGASNGDFSIIGGDLFEVSCQILEQLMPGGELVTLVTGEEAGDLAQRVEAWIAEQHAGVDCVVYEGGQARYPLLFAVE